MKRHIYFGPFSGDRWPPLDQLEPFFLAPKGKEWSYDGGNDSWGMSVKGLAGTDGLPEIDQVKVTLYMFGNPDHGVYLAYRKWDGRIRHDYDYAAKGDLSRIGEFVDTLHGTPLSVGLFIPFRQAWKAVKEFMQTDGKLPESIEWIDIRDLPPETFPDPERPSMRKRPSPT